jgi:hypothetical protein
MSGRWLRSARWMGGGLLLVLAGCYQSKLPLGPPQKGTIDTRLVGSWSCLASDSKAAGASSVWVHPFDDTQYVVEFHDPEDVTHYRAYSTRVGGANLLNVRELTTKSGGDSWMFIRYRIETDGRLRVWIVDDDALGGLKGAPALSAIKKRVADDSLYHDLMTCQPQEPKP